MRVDLLAMSPGDGALLGALRDGFVALAMAGMPLGLVGLAGAAWTRWRRTEWPAGAAPWFRLAAIMQVASVGLSGLAVLAAAGQWVGADLGPGLPRRLALLLGSAVLAVGGLLGWRLCLRATAPDRLLGLSLPRPGHSRPPRWMRPRRRTRGRAVDFVAAPVCFWAPGYVRAAMLVVLAAGAFGLYAMVVLALEARGSPPFGGLGSAGRRVDRPPFALALVAGAATALVAGAVVVGWAFDWGRLPDDAAAGQGLLIAAWSSVRVAVALALGVAAGCVGTSLLWRRAWRAHRGRTGESSPPG